jgi:SAM-dependent methyltransferase
MVEHAMNNGIFAKLVSAIKNDGPVGAFAKTVRYLSPAAIAHRREYREMLTIGDAKTRFEQIYAKNLWSDPESGSGTGSNLAATEEIRKALPELFERYAVKTVLDVPCGDYYWMRHVIEPNPQISYIGGDIVSSVIEANMAAYTADNVRFAVLDLTTDDLPDADLLIVRDCLFHLSFEDIAKVKANIKRSNVKYLLTTTHLVDKGFLNSDIVTGDFRLIDIFAAPLSFHGTVLERINDYAPSEPPRQMCLLEVASM